MKTFDFRAAWKKLAQPRFSALPQNIRDLYQRVSVECKGLAQGKDLNMPWPANDSEYNVQYLSGHSLRELFDKTPAGILAQAARVIHDYGHWYPGNNPEKTGAHWKFSNYADQSLVARINPLLGRETKTVDRGIGFKIHEGFIRVQCSTRGSWTWTELCPAILSNWEKIQTIPRPEPKLLERDYLKAFDEVYLKELQAVVYVPDNLKGFLDTSKYMVEESEIATREAREIVADPNRLEKAKQALLDRLNKALYKAQDQYAADYWILTNGFDPHNVIYYDHVPELCFGWSKPYTLETAQVLDKEIQALGEVPYQYKIKLTTGGYLR